MTSLTATASKLALFAAALSISSAAWVQTAKDDLAKPPANARHFIIQSTGGQHGESFLWTAPDGTRMGRESMNLRGQVWEQDYSGTVGPDGLPSKITIRGVSPSGDAAETFDITGGVAKWKSQIDGGSEAYSAPKFYTSMGGPVALNAWFLESLLAAPNQTLNLLPGGTAKAEKMTTLEVGEGDKKQILTLWSVTGIGTSPTPIWADANNKFFALTFGIAWIPADYASEQKKMEKVQAEQLALLAPANYKKLVKEPAGAVAFTNVRIFDADKLLFTGGQTVIVDKGKIAWVGEAGKAKVPAGTQIIDGTGKTLSPGLWDVHMHVNNDFTGVQELSMGVTSIRDPGNDDAQTMDRWKRIGEKTLLFPNVYASSLIDGKGVNTAQVANVANSEAEAIQLVEKAKANGFVGVKFYGTLNKDWLAPAIKRAHELGLHVHGHVPVGLRPHEAVEAGYDELTHVNWAMMEAMPDEVINQSNGIQRFQGPGRYAKDVDLDGPEMTKWIKLLADRKVYSDPTMVAFEGLYVPENGELSPSYAPFLGTMPPTTERGFRSGGFAVPVGLTRADWRASWAKMIQLIGKMHKAGVPIVAGTDGFGIELIHELEIYVAAGMTPAEALAAATIVPARMLKVDKRTGSIAVGKDADLVLIEGDPSTNIGMMRQTRVVMLGGKLLNADELRGAAGFGGRPK